MRIHRFLLNVQGAEGNGSTSEGSSSGATGSEASRGAAFIAKHNGSASEAVEVLLGEGHRYREEIRELKAKVPPTGSRVLSPDDAQRYDAWTSLGNLDDVKRKLKEFPAIESKVKTYDREKELAEVLKAAKVDASKVGLVSRFAPEDAAFEVKDGKDDKGNEIKVVTVKAGDNEPVAFDQFFDEILPALRPAATEPEPKPGPKGTPRGVPPIVRTRSDDDGDERPLTPKEKLRARGIYG